jgi:hypothetical protein
LTPATVLGQLKLLTEIPPEEETDTIPVCAAAMLRLNARRKRPPPLYGDSLADDLLLSRAAAILALEDILTRQMNTPGGGFTGIKVGDITMHAPDVTAALVRVRALRQDAFSDCTHLLRDSDFYCGATKFRS